MSFQIPLDWEVNKGVVVMVTSTLQFTTIYIIIMSLFQGSLYVKTYIYKSFMMYYMKLHNDRKVVGTTSS